MEVNGQLYALAALSPVATDRRLGRPQRKSGSSGKEKRSLFLLGIELNIQPVSLSPNLLSYPRSFYTYSKFSFC
jgi:hypothetical protein